MDQMQSQSSVPLLLTYRGIGSGGGQTEFKGSNATGTYVPFNDFGSGDVPMPQATWSTLTENGLPFAQIPIMVRSCRSSPSRRSCIIRVASSGLFVIGSTRYPALTAPVLMRDARKLCQA